jgi:cytochrome oxidase Cu insertion factor (SCO1/SenC/PrrC family)
MFYSIYAHRKSVGHKAENFHENITVEIIWAIIPFVILIAVAWPATKSILNLKDTWPPQSRLNYGELIQAFPLSDPRLRRLDRSSFRLSQLRGKWVLLLIDSGVCAESCRKKLLYLRQVRLAQGEDAGRIERVWLVADAAPPDAMLLADYPGMHVARATASPFLAEFPAPRDPAGYIYLVDPLGNLMRRFPASPDPQRMLKDLAHLLRASRIG